MNTQYLILLNIIILHLIHLNHLLIILCNRSFQQRLVKDPHQSFNSLIKGNVN